MKNGRIKVIRAVWPVGETLLSRELLARLEEREPGKHREHDVQNSLVSMQRSGEAERVNPGERPALFRRKRNTEKPAKPTFNAAIMPSWLGVMAVQAAPLTSVRIIQNWGLE